MPFALAQVFILAQTPAKDTIPVASNVTRVDAFIMCDGTTTPEAFPEITKRGFASILNLRRESEPGLDIAAARTAAAAADLKSIHVPVDPGAPSVDAFLKAVTDRSNHPMIFTAVLPTASARRG